ncbi:Hg(II)-responsive transcriptional regulator [Vulcanibacillus modesticaldus]|uniref:Mercuric resistance operon regulatory protein n=1 Tax=Vulcanibacillus modesticaldus TaxID=337097 RepID=A0A1D2YX39_9BACI|nr:Hg(II)-responsive transcriptional regulator [Vulcanibacillus modesticaldus]OEG00238.1 Hg(II)-responsive transcriptional regulator [Vulcanibacillus modesticaldus]
MNYQIGEIAKKCNINKETLRYYERIGLIPQPSRTDSGYRIYTEDIVNRINFIKRMQELSFSLKEIGKLLSVVDKEDIRCLDIHEFVVQKIEDVQKMIRDLRKIEEMLEDLKARCPDEKALYECPIIDTLMEKRGD